VRARESETAEQVEIFPSKTLPSTLTPVPRAVKELGLIDCVFHHLFETIVIDHRKRRNEKARSREVRPEERERLYE
jgi:hypothetical protein